jgi:hypothetical protein
VANNPVSPFTELGKLGSGKKQVRIRSGIRTAGRKWGPVDNGDRRLPIWPDPAGRWRWDDQLYALQTLDLTDRFELPKGKRLVFLDGAVGGAAELISMKW